MESLFLFKWVLNWPNLVVLLLGVVMTIIAYRKSYKDNSRQLRSYVPSLWTSLGILGTFVCICLGLGTISSEDINIVTIVDKIVPAFSTSIIGIIGAIVTSYIDKSIISSDELQDKEVLDSLAKGKKINSAEPDVLLLGYVREIRDALNQSNSRINTIIETNRRDKVEIMERVSKSLAEQRRNFETAMSQLKVDFSEAVKKSSEDHVNKTDEMYKEFKSQLEKIDSKNQSIINTLVTVATDRIKDIKEQLVKESQTREESLKKYMSEGTESFKKYVGEQRGLFNDIVDNLNTSLEEFSTDTKKLFTEEIQETISTFANEQRNECSKIIKEQLEQLIRNVQGSIDVLTSSLGQMTEEVNNSASKWIEAYDESLLRIHDDNVEKLQKMLDGHLTEYGKVTECVHIVSRDMCKQISREYEEFVNQCKSLGEKCHGHIDASVEEHRKLLATFAETYSATLGSTADRIDQCNQKIEGNLARLYETMNTTTEELKKHHSEEMKKIDEKVYESEAAFVEIKAAIVKSSSELVRSLKEEIKASLPLQSFENACSGLADKIAETANTYKECAQSTETSLGGVVTQLEAFKNLSEETEMLNRYVNSTIDAYREHSNTTGSIVESLVKIASLMKVLSETYEDSVKKLNDFCDGNIKKAHKV